MAPSSRADVSHSSGADPSATALLSHAQAPASSGGADAEMGWSKPAGTGPVGMGVTTPTMPQRPAPPLGVPGGSWGVQQAGRGEGQPSGTLANLCSSLVGTAGQGGGHGRRVLRLAVGWHLPSTAATVAAPTCQSLPESIQTTWALSFHLG